MIATQVIQNIAKYKKYLLAAVLLSLSSTFSHAEGCYPKARLALVDIGQKINLSITKNNISEVKQLIDALALHKDIKDCQKIQNEVAVMQGQREKIIANMEKKIAIKEAATKASQNPALKDSYVKAHAVYDNIQQTLQSKSTEKIDTDTDKFNLYEPSSKCYYEAEKLIRHGKGEQETAFELDGSSVSFGKVLSDCDRLLKAKNELIVSVYQHNEAIRKGARKQELADWQVNHAQGAAQQKVFVDERKYIPRLKKSDGAIIWQYKSSTTARSSDKDYIADTEISVTTEIETRTTQCTDYTFSADGEKLLDKKVYGCDW